jgi:hypothetical protein
MTRKTNQKQIDELKGEIELKATILEANQELFAKQLRGGLGDEIKKQLSKPPEVHKESLWRRIVKNFKKLNT